MLAWSMESHGKSWKVMDTPVFSLQSCFLVTPQRPPQVRRSPGLLRSASADCLFKNLFPSVPLLISIPQTEPRSLCLYDCLPVEGIRFDGAVFRRTGGSPESGRQSRAQLLVPDAGPGPRGGGAQEGRCAGPTVCMTPYSRGNVEKMLVEPLTPACEPTRFPRRPQILS